MKEPAVLKALLPCVNETAQVPPARNETDAAVSALERARTISTRAGGGEAAPPWASKRGVSAGNASGEALEETLRSLSDDASVHGILLLRPLPAALDEARILRAIAPEKDEDGAAEGSLPRCMPTDGLPLHGAGGVGSLDYWRNSHRGEARRAETRRRTSGGNAAAAE